MISGEERNKESIANIVKERYIVREWTGGQAGCLFPILTLRGEIRTPRKGEGANYKKTHSERI